MQWIDIVGLDKSDVLSVYQKKVICGNRFEDRFSSPGTKRLNANAYPTLNLPGITYRHIVDGRLYTRYVNLFYKIQVNSYYQYQQMLVHQMSKLTKLLNLIYLALKFKI